MKYVIGYIRVSAEKKEQEKKLKAQENILINFCRINNMELLNIFYDEKTEENENFEKRTGLILAVDQIKIYEKSDTPVSYLIGENFDAFAEDKALLGYIQFQLARHNCSIFSINKENNNILMDIGTTFAAYEKEMAKTIDILENKKN